MNPDLQTMQLLHTRFTTSQWRALLSMESVALELATRCSAQNPAQTALIYTILGETCGVLRMFEKAIQLGEVGLTWFEKTDNIRAQVIMCKNLGSWHHSLGQHTKSIISFKQACKCQNINKMTAGYNPVSEDFMERLFVGLGQSYMKVAQFHKAVQTFKKSLKLAKERKDQGRLGVGIACENLGSAYGQLGQFNTAMDMFQQAYDIAKEENGHGLPDVHAQMRTNGLIGLMHFSLGMYPAAIGQFELAMQKAVSNGSKFDEGSLCANLGCCHSKVGQHETAIALQEKGLQIFQILNDRTSQGQAHSYLASCLEASGAYAQAIQSHLQARKIAKEVGNRAGEPVILGALGGCFTALGQNSQAIACHQEQLSIAQSMTEGLVVVKRSCYLATAWVVELIDLHHEVVNALLDLGVATMADSRVHNLNDPVSSPTVTERLQPADTHLLQLGYTYNADMQCLSAVYFVEALKLAKDQGYGLEVEHAHLYLAFLAFDADLEDKALFHARGYLQSIVDQARFHCRGCWQNRGKDSSMLTCSGCSVVKFCDVNHQRIASRRGGRYRTRKTVSHKDICGLLKQWHQVDKGLVLAESCNQEILEFLRTYDRYYTPSPAHS